MNITEALNVLDLKNEVTLDELKKTYKKLALNYHPDRNPIGAELMKMINEAYNYLIEHFENIKIFTSKNNEDAYYNFGGKMEFVLKNVSQMEGVIYEIIGNWLWIYGETKAHKDKLKELNCKWANKKQCWYFRPAEHKCLNNRKEHSLDEIRSSYSSHGKKKGFNYRLQTVNACEQLAVIN